MQKPPLKTRLLNEECVSGICPSVLVPVVREVSDRIALMKWIRKEQAARE